MTAAVAVRALQAADIPALAGVLARAYQSQQDFHSRLDAYLRMRAVATFVADCDGEPVGMVVGNDYGATAYVSQMAVDPPKQRRGTGTALMEALVAWADRRAFDAIELDATPSGAPLYARYGFRTAGETLVYDATAVGGDVRSARRYVAQERDALLQADARAFGADRSDVLRLLLDSPHSAVFVIGAAGAADGYAVAQRRSGLLGPIVARSSGAAGQLLDAARSQLTATHHLSIPSENRAALTLLAERGYRFARPLAHMVRGKPPSAARDGLYARINLGQG